MSLRLDNDIVKEWLDNVSFRPDSEVRFGLLKEYMLTTVIPLYNAAVQKINDRKYRRKYGNPVSVWFRTQMHNIESRFRSLNLHRDTMAKLERFKNSISDQQAMNGMYIGDARKRALFSPSMVWTFLVVADDLLREHDAAAKKLQRILSTRVAKSSRTKRYTSPPSLTF